MEVISCCTPQLEDLPELIHRIQSLLPVKEAARTCIFDEVIAKSSLVLPTTSASKSALKELFLSIWVGKIDSFTLPDEIFSSANLNEIKNIGTDVRKYSLCIPHNRVILGVSLRGFKTIKLKNLRCLRELEIISIEENDILEFDDVPSLGFFHYNSPFQYCKKPLPFNMIHKDSVDTLDRLSNVVLDDAFFDMIKSKFPFLESLSLGIVSRGLESIVITSLPLKRLTLRFWVDIMTIDVQVYAPKLLFFFYDGRVTVPSLSFPIIAPAEIKLGFILKNTVDHSFFIKIREALSLSSKFDIDIIVMIHKALVSSKTKVDDLRRRVSFPVTNVQQLSLITFSNCKVEMQQVLH
ncbi:hypothetical protein Tco_0606805 [Tanacetum coccineum]